MATGRYYCVAEKRELDLVLQSGLRLVGGYRCQLDKRDVKVYLLRIRRGIFKRDVAVEIKLMELVAKWGGYVSILSNDDDKKSVEIAKSKLEKMIGVELEEI